MVSRDPKGAICQSTDFISLYFLLGRVVMNHIFAVTVCAFYQKRIVASNGIAKIEL